MWKKKNRIKFLLKDGIWRFYDRYRIRYMSFIGCGHMSEPLTLTEIIGQLDN